MPAPVNLFPEFSGKAVGAAGHAAGGLLGQLSDILAAPRKALWGLFGAPETGGEVVRNLGGDSESPLGKILGMGLEILGDPLTFLGGPLLRGLGGLAGRSLTKGAVQAGPGFAADAAKLAVPGMEGSSTLAHLLKANPDDLARVASEIPEGTKFLGAGAEGVAYKTPAGGVVRVERGVSPGFPPPERLNVPEVLQPARVARSGDLQIEHLPMVETWEARANPFNNALDMLPQGGTPRQLRNIMDQRRLIGDQLDEVHQVFQGGADKLHASAKARGLDPADMHLQNAGLTSEGRWVTHDPNAILPEPGSALDMATTTNFSGTNLRGPQPGPVKSALLNMLGGQGRLRDWLARETSTGGIGQGIL